VCESDQAEVGRLRRRYERERRARLQAEAIAEQFTRDALHDPLTKLPNRTLLLDRLRLALARAVRLQSLVAVLFVDLDGFKAVNDSLGHAAGDQLLVQVAERIRQCLRPADTVARLGGDEFAVLLEDLGHGGERAVAERILEALRAPVVVEGTELVTRASIGIAVGTSAEEGAGDLLRQADLAMYTAKAGGKDRHAAFEPAMHATALARLELEAELRRALDHDQLVVYYQPVCELPTGRLMRTEALVRWQQPQRGLLSPAEFIPLAEERGLIIPLGQWVLRQACQETRRWQQRHPSDPPLGVAVNLSAGQLRPGFVDSVADILRKTGLDPRCLTLEITETLLMDEAARTLEHLMELKDLGVQLSIDDFGTGYSSLGRLRSFPIDEVKIDRSFVDDIAPGRTGGPLVAAVTAMGHALGLRVVAEGVETFEQLRFLLGRGCDAVQGYLVGRPVPASVLQLLLTDPASDHGLGETLQVDDEAPMQDPSDKIADLIAEAATTKEDLAPLVRALLSQLERTAGLESTYLALAYNGQELLIGTPPDDDGSGAAGAAGPWHHLRVPVVAADGRTVGTLDGVSRLQSEQEAKVLIMMNLLARTIADRLDPGASATPRRQAPQASSMPSRHGRTSA
jgi:diguanylate cyclase (GGDEF)-like protein